MLRSACSRRARASSASRSCTAASRPSTPSSSAHRPPHISPWPHGSSTTRRAISTRACSSVEVTGVRTQSCAPAVRPRWTSSWCADPASSMMYGGSTMWKSRTRRHSSGPSMRGRSQSTIATRGGSSARSASSASGPSAASRSCRPSASSDAARLRRDPSVPWAMSTSIPILPAPSTPARAGRRCLHHRESDPRFPQPMGTEPQRELRRPPQARSGGWSAGPAAKSVAGADSAVARRATRGGRRSRRTAARRARAAVSGPSAPGAERAELGPRRAP